MTDIHIINGTLVVSIRGIRRLGTFKKELNIPLSQVRGATVDPEISTSWPGMKAAGEWPGTKILGTDAYGHDLGGTFRQDGERVFWDVTEPAHAIVISLQDHEYRRLIVDVDDPEAVVRSIETALTPQA
ncbi:hypothetical protein [Micrococcus terreus]|uniref:hypothetical protein n=1 Tax=Micrococcus terreus TaxID=574650 RepID=UPI003D719E91